MNKLKTNLNIICLFVCQDIIQTQEEYNTLKSEYRKYREETGQEIKALKVKNQCTLINLKYDFWYPMCTIYMYMQMQNLHTVYANHKEKKMKKTVIYLKTLLQLFQVSLMNAGLYIPIEPEPPQMETTPPRGRMPAQSLLAQGILCSTSYP